MELHTFFYKWSRVVSLRVWVRRTYRFGLNDTDRQTAPARSRPRASVSSPVTWSHKPNERERAPPSQKLPNAFSGLDFYDSQLFYAPIAKTVKMKIVWPF